MNVLQFFLDNWMWVLLGSFGSYTIVPWFIKVIRDHDKGGKTRFHIQQGRSEADIAQQPKNGFTSKEAAEAHKNTLVKKGERLSFWKEERFDQDGKVVKGKQNKEKNKSK